MLSWVLPLLGTGTSSGPRQGECHLLLIFSALHRKKVRLSWRVVFQDGQPGSVVAQMRAHGVCLPLFHMVTPRVFHSNAHAFSASETHLCPKHLCWAVLRSSLHRNRPLPSASGLILKISFLDNTLGSSSQKRSPTPPPHLVSFYPIILFISFMILTTFV